jgi:hypothetical protein
VKSLPLMDDRKIYSLKVCLQIHKKIGGIVFRNLGGHFVEKCVEIFLCRVKDYKEPVMPLGTCEA